MTLRCSFPLGARRLRWVAGTSLLAALAACGGGDNNNNMAQGGGGSGGVPVQATSVPASAFASTSSFIAYLAALQPDNTAEPLTVDGTPPVSDNVEPVPV